LDPNQYQQDMTNTIQNGAEDVYDTFNVIMRRKPKENNFKVMFSSAAKTPYTLEMKSKRGPHTCWGEGLQ
jgi:hypothetical protein